MSLLGIILGRPSPFERAVRHERQTMGDICGDAHDEPLAPAPRGLNYSGRKVTEKLNERP